MAIFWILRMSASLTLAHKRTTRAVASSFRREGELCTSRRGLGADAFSLETARLTTLCAASCALFAVRSGNTRCAQYLRPAHRSSHSLTACFACFLHAACFAAWTTTRHTNPVLTITRCWCAPRAAHGTCELVGRMCLCSSEPFGRVILLVVAACARPDLRFRKTVKAHSVLRACLLDALARRI